MDICDRLLRSTVYGKFSEVLLDKDPKTLYTLLKILEKLGTLLFQSLPAAILERYLPKDVEVVYPNVHLNVPLALFQSRDGTVARRHMEESLDSIKDTNDPHVRDYHLKRAHGNPATTVVWEHIREMKGKVPSFYETLPEILRQYLFR